MPTVTASTTINQAVDKVFDYLVNVENHTSWNQGLEEARVTPDGPVGVGSEYHYVTKVMGNKMESAMKVTAFEPNKTWAVATIGIPTTTETVYSFEGSGDTTTLTISMMVPEGAYPAAAAGAIMGQMQKNLEEQGERIKQAVGG